MWVWSKRWLWKLCTFSILFNTGLEVYLIWWTNFVIKDLFSNRYLQVTWNHPRIRIETLSHQSTFNCISTLYCPAAPFTNSVHGMKPFSCVSGCHSWNMLHIKPNSKDSNGMFMLDFVPCILWMSTILERERFQGFYTVEGNSWSLVIILILNHTRESTG